jgi:hypothetical protein
MGNSNMLQQPSPLWRMLFRPMLAISLILHGLVLVIPIPERDAASEPEEPEVAEEAIRLSSFMPPPSQPTPTPQVSSPPSPAALPTPVAVSPPLPSPSAIAPTQPPPSASPTPEASPEATPEATPATPQPEQTAASPEPSPQPFDPQLSQQLFLENFQDIEGEVPIAPGPNVIDQPLMFFTSEEPDAEPVSGIRELRWVNDRDPEDVYASLEQSYAQNGNTFRKIESGYGGGSLYALQSPEGEPFLYLNLVPGRGGASTIIAVWDHDPNASPAQ